MVVIASFPAIRSYIESAVLPAYDRFDPAHRRDHVATVIEQSMQLADHYPVCKPMVYVIAAYHDLGLSVDRKTHHLESGRILREDRQLRNWFSPEDIETMAQAVEDHRASSDHAPRSIYGKIVAEADRQIDIDTIIRRTLQYGFSHYPDLTKKGHIARAIDHLRTKYGEGGYLKLWLPESPNAARLARLQALIKDRPTLLRTVEDAYRALTTVTCETPFGTLIFPLSSDFSDQLHAELSGYFQGKRRTFSPNLMQAVEQSLPSLGTPFQQAVWHGLMDIPYGTTVTYSDLAQRIGHPKAVRAVGAACHRNPFPLLIPCHRVISSRSIGGFAFGVPAKQTLLRLESAPFL